MLPMVILTPTWRANVDRLARAGLDGLDVNGDCVRFMADLAAEYGAYASQVYIGGLIGPAGDAYRPQDALPASESESFHAFQVQALARAGVDFLMAATLPAFSEALGMARAMVHCGRPYILSFVVRPTGTLLDGTPLHEAVRRIDTTVSPNPLCYLVNCVHPMVYEQAMRHELASWPALGARVLGLQGNTSHRSPEELDNLTYLETEAPPVFAAAMIHLHERFGAKMLGGCCGTDDRHIDCIARQVSTLVSPQSAL